MGTVLYFFWKGFSASGGGGPSLVGTVFKSAIVRAACFLLALTLAAPAWGQTMPNVLTPELRAKWPEMSRQGNPWATYGEYSIAADPLWWPHRNVTRLYMAHLSVGTIEVSLWGGAADGETALDVNPLRAALKAGTVLDFGGGATCELTQRAYRGDMVLFTTPLKASRPALAVSSASTVHHHWDAANDVLIEKSYLELAIEECMKMPDISAGDQIEHLYELEYVRNYLILKTHLTDENRAELERRLKALGEHLVGAVRIGDIDQAEISGVAYWRILDRFLGTDYMTRAKPIAVSAWVDEFYALDTFKGGPRDASSHYEQSTASGRCQAAAIYGKDIFPWFDAWAKAHTNWLPMSVSKNLRHGVAWGDQQGDDGGKVLGYHRLQLCFMLAGLGYDEDGALISLGKKLMGGTPTIGNPHSVYPYAGMGFTFTLDPGRIMSAPDVPLVDGFHVAEGIGTTVLRDGRHFVYTNFPATVRKDGSRIPTEDHHYSGHFADPTWIYMDVPIVTQPRGYAYGAHDGANEFHSNNAIAMKCDGHSANQRFLGTTRTPNGFTSVGEWFGPTQRFHHPIPPDRWTEANAYDGCKIVSGIAFDRAEPALAVLDKWNSPGDTFPDWTGDLPVFQRCQFALAPMTEQDGVLSWTVNGITVRCHVKMLDGNGVKVQPKFVIEPKPLQMNGLEYYRAFIQSPKDLFVGSLDMRFVPAGEPIVPPPVEPPPVPPPPFEPTPPIPDGADAFILDDSAARLTGAWIKHATGYGGTLHYTSGGAHTATWTATVTPGKYRVAATWPGYENRATNADYAVGSLTLKVNQKPDPASFTGKDGTKWHTLGEVAATDTITVKLDAQGADGHLIADAVRFERIGEPPPVDPPPVDPPPVDEPLQFRVRTLSDGTKELFAPLP